MSQLVHMRQRLKAIETIKKITSAMRLISRSLHTRLNKQKAPFKTYQQTISNLFEKLQQLQPHWQPELFFPRSDKYTKKLYIITGAQKGLCGSYNAELLYWFAKEHETLSQKTIDIIAIGKRTADDLARYNIKPLQCLEELKISSVEQLTQELLTFIKTAKPHYTQVILIGTVPESFFVNRLQKITLLPLSKNNTENNPDSYLWQNEPDKVLEMLAHMYLYTTVYNLLFEALLGEQAARFIAMDGATRNANKFLDTMQLQYNKIRQAKITKELTELAANFQS